MNWYKKSNSEVLYHASPKDNLDIIGIDPDASPHVSSEPQGWAYLGSEDYVLNHYLDYAKKGTYYIYRVNIRGLNLDGNLAGEQVRTKDFIEPERITMLYATNSSPSTHPLEKEYLEWWNTKNKK